MFLQINTAGTEPSLLAQQEEVSANDQPNVSWAMEDDSHSGPSLSNPTPAQV